MAREQLGLGHNNKPAGFDLGRVKHDDVLYQNIKETARSQEEHASLGVDSYSSSFLDVGGKKERDVERKERDWTNLRPAWNFIKFKE